MNKTSWMALSLPRRLAGCASAPTAGGQAAMAADARKARRAAEYPLDKATGYPPGRIRGIASIQRPL